MKFKEFKEAAETTIELSKEGAKAHPDEVHYEPANFTIIGGQDWTTRVKKAIHKVHGVTRLKSSGDREEYSKDGKTVAVLFHGNEVGAAWLKKPA